MVSELDADLHGYMLHQDWEKAGHRVLRVDYNTVAVGYSGVLSRAVLGVETNYNPRLTTTMETLMSYLLIFVAPQLALLAN